MPYLVAADVPKVSAGARFRELVARPGILQMPGTHNFVFVAIDDEGKPRPLALSPPP